VNIDKNGEAIFKGECLLAPSCPIDGSILSSQGLRDISLRAVSHVGFAPITVGGTFTRDGFFARL
jgi:hypothetical protein